MTERSDEKFTWLSRNGGSMPGSRLSNVAQTTPVCATMLRAIPTTVSVAALVIIVMKRCSVSAIEGWVVKVRKSRVVS